MRKGIRNLKNRLNSDYDGTIETLQNEGYLVCEVDERLGGNFCEKSGTCITPNSVGLNTPSEWLEKNGVNFGLDFYTLFGFETDENGEYVDYSTIECYNFQRFADDLGELLKRHKCIMQTYKYKKCVIAPAPREVFYLDEWGQFVAVYQPVLFNFKKLDKVIQEIHALAYEHLTWQMTSERREKAKERLARIHALQEIKRREEYEERVWGADIPQKFFDLVRATISAFSNSQGFYERLERQTYEQEFALRNLAYRAMRANCKDPVDIVMMLES